MFWYPTLITFHIIFAGIWLTGFLSEIIFKRQIINNRGKSGENKFILIYMKYINLSGMIGSMGILLTGILLVVMNPGYGFFQMSANHWLATKQIVMVIILAVIFANIIPASKRIRTEIGSDLENSAQLSSEGYNTLSKLFKMTMLINVLVLINFLLAITHRFFG